MLLGTLDVDESNKIFYNAVTNKTFTKTLQYMGPRNYGHFRNAYINFTQ